MSWLFPIAQHPPQASLSFSNVFSPDTLVFLLIQLILMVFSKGAHPHLRELFLHPTSMRSTFTSHRLPNMHPFRLLTKPVMPLHAIHIHLVHGFSILGPLITFLVIRIIFSSLTITSLLSMITLTNGSQTMAKGIGSACPLPSVPLTYVLYVHYCPFNLISISKLTRDLNCLITFSNNSVTL